MANPTRTDTFDYNKNYNQVVQIGGRIDQDWSYSQIQQEEYFRNYDLWDQLWNEGVVLSGLTASSLNNSTGVAILNTGTFYLYGRALNVTGATLNFGVPVVNNTVYLKWLSQQITKVQDPTLVDPSTGSAVFEEAQIVASLDIATPDAFDENFESFVSGVPHNPLLNANWTKNSGTISQNSPAKFGRYALQMNHVAGTATTLTSPSFTVTPSTIYYIYFWTKTVYGQQDLIASDGAFLRFNVATPNTSIFSTTGGATLFGGYTQNIVPVTTGVSDTSASITISVPGLASPSSTQILVDSILITTVPLSTSVIQLERHYVPMYFWNRTTTPTVLTPAVTPKTRLSVSDLSGQLDCTEIIFNADGGTAPDITTGTAQTAIDQLSTQRALLAGANTQTFKVGLATTRDMAPEVGQIQDNKLTYGVDTGAANAYQVNLAPALTAYVTGMRLTFLAAHSNTTGSTIQFNAAGLVAVLRPDGSALQAGDIIINRFYSVTYNSGSFFLETASNSGIAGFSNLTGKNNAGTPNTQFDVAADIVIARNPSGGSTLIANSLAATVNISITGVNGRDVVGAIPNGFFHIYSILGAGQTAALVASTVAPPTGPTLPTNYTHWAYAGTFLLTGGNIVASFLRGNTITYSPRQNIVSQAAFNSTAEQTASTAAAVPAIAYDAILHTIFDVTSGGSASDVNISLKLVSGVDHYIEIIRIQASQSNKYSSYVEIPNVNQNLYYQMDTSLGTTNWYIWVIGYRVPNRA